MKTHTPTQKVYTYRTRYVAQAQMTLGKPNLADRKVYLVAYDELLIGLGRNMAKNEFDQNRLGLPIGYRFGKVVRIEEGFFSSFSNYPTKIKPRWCSGLNRALLSLGAIDVHWKQQ
ncbi:DUF2490 domain-containing protein [Spirosoma sp. SC4-14]|uniref:DUF2490 domain-containing protein n=1 Tax=Spirosoma sp. SC4-14 TaxID=3128900 RepID=UPI0030CDD27E